MVLGFLAGLVMAERGVAIGAGSSGLPVGLRAVWPTFTGGLGAFLVGWLVRFEPLIRLGGILMVLGAALFTYTTWQLFKLARGPIPYLGVLGALSLLASTATLAYPGRTGWTGFVLLLLGFPLLFILGERLVLLSSVPRFRLPGLVGLAQPVGALSLGWLIAATFLALPDHYLTPTALGLLLVGGIIALADISATRHTIGGGKLRTYLKAHTLAAYLWLLLGLALLLPYTLGATHPRLYDSFIHSLAVGFIGTMLMAHGPMVLPALLGRSAEPEKLSLLPLGLLVGANGLRVGGGLLAPVAPWLRPLVGWSGLLILVVLLTFLLMVRRCLR
jgi:hypothetical protein